MGVAVVAGLAAMAGISPFSVMLGAFTVGYLAAYYVTPRVSRLTRNIARSLRNTAEEVENTVNTAFSPFEPTSTNANGNQPPQRPTENNRSNSVHVNHRLLLLQRRLSQILRNLRQHILVSDTDRDPISQAVRRHQRGTFHQIYTTISELIANGYSASIQRSNQSEVNLVISSPDRLWREVIEYQLADYLDVHDQLIHQEFERRWSRDVCPTILSARFQGSQLVLSPQVNLGGATNVIYGIRCRKCDRRLGPCNINYVGQTTLSLRERVDQHACAAARTFINGITENTPFRPMYEHAADRSLHDLPPGILPRQVFGEVMEVILLPTGSGDLRSWECFWQFFCHCRTFFYGWSHQ
ncbi:uncharacterized protein LOC124193654 [Daphnia pulex]|uniref:uncharacterized protein LOC124193654 n=1 Tax=Daphnia pulex TaxID=6669 RepID=UPI001EDFEC46|nr:uncharacterized protein LOC124193654 [Daphnia pulex]